MANRILTWFIPGGLDDNTEQGPRHFVSEDSEIVASQVSAERAPGGTFTYDILDDDVSIMSDNPQSSNQATYAQGQVEYTTLDVSTFAVSETVSGGSSGSTAIVEVDNAIGSMRVSSETGAFTVGETITGLTSSATGVVSAHVREVYGNILSSRTVGSLAQLDAGETQSAISEDFDSQRASILGGSWVKLVVRKMGGAQGVTVHLEIDSG